MSDFTAPPTGSEIELTFKGTVSDVVTDMDCGGNHTFEIFFEGGESVSWLTNPNVPKHPELKITNPGWRVGDIGWYTRPDGGGRRTVMYGYADSRAQEPVWRDGNGNTIKVSAESAHRITVVARATDK